MAEERVLERQVDFFRIKGWMRKEKVLSERDVLQSVKKGDREAYGVIVTRYMKTAYYIALGFVHNHQDALDISQEAFIKAYRKIKNFDTQKHFLPWFYRLLRNLCFDHLNRRSRRSEIPVDGIQILKEENEDREMKEVLWKGIERLPFEQREIIILRYFRQLSYQEIAEITAKPIGTVMSSLYYARKRLKGIIGTYLSFDKK